MSIETELARIADALEALAGGRAAPQPEAEAQTEAEPSKPAKASKPAKEEASSDEQPSLDDVREALKALQKATDGATAKSLLTDRGAKTLSELDEGAYAEVIAEAERLANE